MSITLMAYPMAFLISPEEAKNEKLKKASEIQKVNQSVANGNLRSIKILTNIEVFELRNFIHGIGGEEKHKNMYIYPNGLTAHWITRGKYAVVHLFGCENSVALQTAAEEYFQDIDSLLGRNVRLIESAEYFYYNYQTEYKDIKDIYNKLKEEEAKNIFSTPNNEIVAEVSGQNIKYYKPDNEDFYLLEVEQKVTIMNIGTSGDYQGINVSFGQLTDLKIQTNIKPEELKDLLRKANYMYYSGNSQTPLKNSNATLNWILKNGYYVAEFSGQNNAAISKEAEIIFRKLNIAAGRDLRKINDQTTIVYTYNTNYTDKGILLNTLTEHGAEELTETSDEITCKLFGMEMVYYKKDSAGAYTLDITQVSDSSECEELINDLNEEYGLNIQEVTYNKIKERLNSENMHLESESVLDDNSIVLTIEV